MNLNTNLLTMDATTALINLDKTLIGTADYMGVAYFWNYTYRHYLRDTSYTVRRRVHAALLAAGLDVDGESPAHLAVIENDEINAKFAGREWARCTKCRIEEATNYDNSPLCDECYGAENDPMDDVNYVGHPIHY